MRPFRNLKLASAIQKELSNILVRDFDFENALVTVLNVEVTKDFLQAKVKLGIIPYEKGPEVFQKLENERRQVQHKILKKMKIRAIPRLKFKIEQEK